MLNGSSGAQVGLAKILSAFNLSAPLAGETGTARAALQEYGTFIAGNGNPGNEDSPKGWLNILVFDRDHNLIDLAFEQLSSDYVQEVGSLIKAPHQLLSKEVTIKEPGYVYIYVSNEGSIAQEIYFDDFMINHKKSPIIQSDDYYPFGLTFNSYQREDNVINRIKFQAQEHMDDLNLGWDSFKWRNHQPDIGRFFNIDPIAEDYYYNSPYAFSENKVTSHIELEGLESKTIHEKELENELKKIEAALSTIVEKVKDIFGTIVPDDQVGDTDIEKLNKKPIPVDEDQKDGGVSKTNVPSDLDGPTNPRFNPKGVPAGKGGEEVMMHDKGQKNVKNPDTNQVKHRLDTLYGTMEYPGASANYFIVVQDGKDTIPPVHHWPKEIPKNAKTINDK